MNDVTSQSWFTWALVIVIGVPVVLIALTELHGALARRGNPLAAPVATLRNFAVPAAALWVLLTQAWDISAEETWVRIIATVVGFLVLVLALSALNVVLFGAARQGSWRQRMPSIFIDIARLVLIVAGLAVLFSVVWGANVGGLFAALGVTTIVLGFALQNAVGSIISGLLLLFEQPFQLGDWLNTGSAKGRVVEVNWRAVHLETGNGVQVIPNASLAGSAFTNLSQPAGPHLVTLTTTFGPNDRPERVRRLLDQVAADLPLRDSNVTPYTDMTGPRTFNTIVGVGSPSDADDVAAIFHRWTWYAAKRHGLHYDGIDPFVHTPEELEEAVGEIATTLRLQPDEVPDVAKAVRIEVWAAGETLMRAGLVPDGVRFVRAGLVNLFVPSTRGQIVVTEVKPGDFMGQAALTREPVVTNAIAADEVTTILVSQALIDQLVRTHAALADDLGRAIDVRRLQVNDALTAADASPPTRRRLTSPHPSRQSSRSRPMSRTGAEWVSSPTAM